MKPCNHITICDQPDFAYVHDPYGIEDDSHEFVRGICAPIVLQFPDTHTLCYLQRESPNAALIERTYDLAPGGLVIGVMDEDNKTAVIVTVQMRTPELEKLWAESDVIVTDSGIVAAEPTQAPIAEDSVG